MLREVFGPAADELAADIRRTGITPACLPAVAHDVAECHDAAADSAMSCLHKAVLAGPADIMQWTQEGLEEHLRRLVAAGLFASEAEARRECMRRWNKLLTRSHVGVAAAAQGGGAGGGRHGARRARHVRPEM